MPTKINKEQPSSNSGLAERPPPIDLHAIEFDNYVSKCPTVFGDEGYSSNWLKTNVIEGRKLLMNPLEELNNLYFNDSKLEALSSHQHKQDRSKSQSFTLDNASFYVSIGIKAAYEDAFDRPKANNKSTPSNCISLKGRGTSTRGAKVSYEELFVGFYNLMFAGNEAELLEASFQNENMLSICIFARSASSTPTNLQRYSDQLIAAASFVMDEHDSVLLSWMGVLDKNLSELNIHDDFQEQYTSIRRQFNIGTFLLIMCQVFKSIIQKKWCPIICQVHGEAKTGPLNFYLKNFFIKSNAYFQLVYSQFCTRKDCIIRDDPQLVWMVLLFPLHDLLMTCVKDKSDWASFVLILIRGYYYFLNRPQNPIRQDTVKRSIESYFGSDEDFYQKGLSFPVYKSLNDDKESLEKYMDVNVEKEEKPTILSAGETIMSKFIDIINDFNVSADETSQPLWLLNLGSTTTESTSADSIFLTLSKLLYGSSHYYMNLRCFLIYYYRSVSLLSRRHPFYLSEDISSIVLELLERVSGGSIPKSMYIAGSDNEIDPRKCRKIFYKFSQYMISCDAEYHDLYIFAAIYGVEFVIINGRSYQFEIKTEEQDREWIISFHRSFQGNEFINSCLIKVQTPRPQKWMVCMLESDFMPIIDNINDLVIDDISFMADSVGLYSSAVDSKVVTDLFENKNEEAYAFDESTSLDLLPLLQKEPFQLKMNIQKMFNKYVSNTQILKFKGSKKEYGKLFLCSDFQQAGVPDEFILGCIRCLDPPQILVEKNIWPINGQCQFTDLMRLRDKTWLNETCTKLFIDYIQSITEKYLFLDPASFNNNITQIKRLMTLIETKGFESHPSKDIIMLFHIENHFIVVEINRSTVFTDRIAKDERDDVVGCMDKSSIKTKEQASDEDNDSKKTPILLACSLNSDLESLVKQVNDRYLDIFLDILIGDGNYEYKLAEHVQMQTTNTMNDCGVICLQRLYKYALYGDVRQDLPTEIQSPMIFRCFILYKILEFWRDVVSPYILYNEKTVQNFLPSNYTTTEQSSDIEEEQSTYGSVAQELLQVVSQEILNSKNDNLNQPALITQVETLHYDDKKTAVNFDNIELHNNSKTQLSVVESKSQQADDLISSKMNRAQTSSEMNRAQTTDLSEDLETLSIVLAEPAVTESLEKVDENQVTQEVGDHPIGRSEAAIEEPFDGVNENRTTPEASIETHSIIHSENQITLETTLQAETAVEETFDQTINETMSITPVLTEVLLPLKRNVASISDGVDDDDDDDGVDDYPPDDYDTDADDAASTEKADNRTASKSHIDDDELSSNEDTVYEESDTEKKDKKLLVTNQPTAIVSSKKQTLKVTFRNSKKKRRVRKDPKIDSSEADATILMATRDTDRSSPIAPQHMSASTSKTRRHGKDFLSKISSPTRSSIRIQKLKALSPVLKSSPRSSNVIVRSPSRPTRDPKNFATGFRVKKLPKTMSNSRKKQLRAEMEKKEKRNEKLNEKLLFFNDLHDVDDLFVAEDTDNLVDLYSDNEWHFVDTSKRIPKSISGDARREMENFFPHMYATFQRDKKSAEEIVKEQIQPIFIKAEKKEKEAKEKLEKLLIKYGHQKHHIVDKANEEFKQAFVEREMLHQEMTGQKLFLPFDAIVAIQILPSNYEKGEYDYFALTHNPNGQGFCKKVVAKEWLYENLEPEFMAKLEQFNETNLWITIDDDVNRLKVIQDTDDLRESLTRFNLRPLYEYKPLRSDDQILIVRCEVRYNLYDLYVKIKKFNWSVVTLKETYSNNPTRVRDLPRDPLAVDENGERIHKSKYNNISKGVLCSVIGCELVYLIEQACVLHGSDERNVPYRLSNAPKFTFADEFERTNKKEPSEKQLKECKSSVKLEGPQKRFYDDKDLTTNDKHSMPLSNVGDFLVPQIYYFDIREFTTKYYISTDSTQISGLYYDETKNKFFGLTKKLFEKKVHVRHIELEDDWVQENFHEEFLELIKRKSKKDQRKFIKVPIGKAKPLSSPSCNLNNPEIRFLQNGKDNCVFASIASALSYMGFELLASMIWKYEEEFVKTQFLNDTYGSVVRIVNETIGSFKFKSFNQKYQLRKIGAPDMFNLIEFGKQNPRILYHVVLMGSDGSENHCVSVFNNYIFDGNYTHAWILQQESLNECIDSTFIGICCGYMHVPIH